MGAPPSFVDVSPRAGTLVVFDSSRVPHEVLETTSPRRAVVLTPATHSIWTALIK